MKTSDRSLWRWLVVGALLLGSAAVPALTAQAEPPRDGPVFAKPGPRVDPEQSETAKAYRRQVAASKTAAAARASTSQRAAAAARPSTSQRVGAAADPLPKVADFSSGTPQTTRDNIAGDFRGAGYEQRMRVEGNQLTIRDPAQQGGKVTHVTTDLEPAPDTIYFNVRTLAGYEPYPLNTYSQWASDKARSNSGGFEFLFDLFHINTVYLAELDGYVYILGTQGSNGYNPDVDAAAPANQYRVRIYKIPMSQAVNGCATSACAVASYDFGTAFNLDGSVGNILPYYPRAIGPSSLAAGHVDGVGYLAVGLTDGGVFILNTNLAVTGSFGGMATPDQSQTPPTALAWDPAGSGLLAVGVTSYWNTGFFTTVNSSGAVTNAAGSIWPSAPGYALIPTPITAAIWQPGDGTTMNSFGMSDWSVQVMQPTTDQYTQTTANISDTGSGIPVAITPTPRVNSAVPGGPDLAVSGQAVADITNTNGTVLRWDPGSTALSHVTVTPNNGTSLTGTTAFDNWFPGLKQGRLSITNSSAEDIDVTIKSSPSAGKGCWYAPDWLDANSFPDPLTLGPGASSTDYVIGFLTSGSDGNCFTTDTSGTKRAYLVISPSARPADQQILQLQVTSALKMVLCPLNQSQVCSDQSGNGTTTATLSAKLGQLAAIGAYNITVNTSAPPTPTANPAVKIVQLTPDANGNDNLAATSPVYKLTVQPLTWNVPGLTSTTAGSRLQAALPPYTVQGRTNGSAWATIGSFLPVGTVNYKPATGTATIGTATVGGGTFYWENTVKESYTDLQVVAGPGQNAPASGPITLTPTTLTPKFAVTGINLVTAQKGATFAPNGVDSLPLTLTINLGAASSSDPTQGVYYRDGDNSKLVTNLYLPGQEDKFFGIQPDAGAYPNTSSTRTKGSTAGASSTDYAVSTDVDNKNVVAVVWKGTTAAGVKYPSASALPVQATAMDLSVSGDSDGFNLKTCAEVTGTCGLAQIAQMGVPSGGTVGRAAVYQAGLSTDDTGVTPPSLGLQFGSIALSNAAGTSLPLTWTADSTPTLSTSTVTLSNNALSVDDASGFPSGNETETIAVPAVSRGTMIMAQVDK